VSGGYIPLKQAKWSHDSIRFFGTPDKKTLQCAAYYPGGHLIKVFYVVCDIEAPPTFRSAHYIPINREGVKQAIQSNNT